MTCEGRESLHSSKKGLARLEKLHWRGLEGPVTVPEPLSAITWNHLRPILASLERVVELALICGAKKKRLRTISDFGLTGQNGNPRKKAK
jgi:hypothetical protein